eukprot:1160974-Pelagomonas_calceolata.AAC.3
MRHVTPAVTSLFLHEQLRPSQSHVTPEINPLIPSGAAHSRPVKGTAPGSRDAGMSTFANLCVCGMCPWGACLFCDGLRADMRASCGTGWWT